MKPAPFGYLRPSSVEELVALLAEHGSDAAILAGGQSLLPLLNRRQRRPTVVLDLAGVAGLDRVDVGHERVELGARVGQRLPPLVTEALPLLAMALPHVGHVQTRNRGTVVGSVAHGDPLAELPLALLVGGGQVELASIRGRRWIPIDQFLDRAFTPARATDEIVLTTRWDRAKPRTGHAFVELSAGVTVAAAAAMVSVEQGQVSSVRIGVAGPAERPLMIGRSVAIEASGIDLFSRELIAELLDGVTFARDGASDPEHRRAVAVELAARAAVAAAADAGSGAGAGAKTRTAGGRSPAVGDVGDVGDSGGSGWPVPRTQAADPPVAPSAGSDVPVTLTVDGRPRSVTVQARTSLADAVRSAGVTGVKLGCEQGVCGSCTVLLDGTSQRSCLVLAVQAIGVEITTAATLTGPMEVLRSAFVDHFAVQCGFCASGVLVTAAAELAEREQAGTLDELDGDAVAGLLSGNVCRCTGYESMVDAILQAARQLGAGAAG